ncbi:MAG TPA: hypothetical protein VNU00_08875 [Candidatus Binataceae bacterium]|nr:hypothetical protein [Candidatus Binataceae bacterium]
MFFLLGALLLAAGCGVKSAPVPPELARPERIADLRAVPDANGIKLSWGRPTRYSGGHTMRDLGGFVILRASSANGQMEPLAELPVTDRERFAIEHEFSYIDNETVVGQVYRYAIVSRTLDGYVSEASNTVDFTRVRPPPPPNPDTFKLPQSASTPGSGG